MLKLTNSADILEFVGAMAVGELEPLRFLVISESPAPVVELLGGLAAIPNTQTQTATGCGS